MAPGLLFVHEPVKFCICWSDREKRYHHHHHHYHVMLPLCWLMQLKSPQNCGDRGDQSCSDLAFKMNGQLSGAKAVDLTQLADEDVMLKQQSPDLTTTSVQQMTQQKP